MSWTDERVSLLTKLWGEGHTAAEIAQKLGGVTRNAVIGKAHRLKLSNRASPIQQNKKVSPKPAANKNEKAPVKVVEKAKAPRIKKAAPAPIEHIQEDPIENRDDLYSLMDLKPRMCRWPHGDPKEEGFGFCGHNAMSGLPYCPEHAKMAYQAATRNRIFKKDDAAVVVSDKKKKVAS